MKSRPKYPGKGSDSSLPAIYLISALLVVVGGGIILASLFLEQRQEALAHSTTTTFDRSSHPGQDGAPASEEAIAWWTAPPAKLFSKMMAEIGLALISIGGIALLLEVPFMSSYFQTKIAQTMTAQEYLRRLKKEQLETLQADSLKAYWELEDIDREGTLYDYCKNQVQSFIAKPYRENVTGVYTITCVDENTHEVEEILSYTCRAIRGRIQPEIKWSTRKGEIGEVQQFSVRLEIPQHIWNELGFQEAHPSIQKVVMDFDQGDIVPAEKSIPTAFQKFCNELKNTQPKFWNVARNKKRPKLMKSDDGERLVYQLGLESYEDVDELRVCLNIKYKAPVGRSLTWQMSHPSKNVTGVVNFPESQRFYLETFGISEQYLYGKDKLTSDSPQKFEYNSWLLPQSGFVFHLLPRSNGNQSCPDQPLVRTQPAQTLLGPLDATH
jgi:hypothetical protein